MGSLIDRLLNWFQALNKYQRKILKMGEAGMESAARRGLYAFSYTCMRLDLFGQLLVLRCHFFGTAMPLTAL
ncbi:hypothetical protein TKWG_24610 [Advenella kashmirensis WT001]|uniref:Uncharacterized protein n=1 Tax=Advenella kashmirensis (strain DSM 17095 / LMG 22695 / WT001) TaxID=1036672 RepID=I3UHI9_ADVKW|nr:hypothetical protein [Advenella kashmirensis]AFK64477.1 hypothetical protein TKWG_24610 [Advenella kashmirensis WT001]